MATSKHFLLFLILGLSLILQACAQTKGSQSQPALTEFPAVITDPANYNELSAQESRVIRNKGTEFAFSGAYHDHKTPGTYLCKQCNLPLFKSTAKFNSGTGWPSFDDAIEGAVKELTDADGMRTEIVCSNCDGHLGHVFRGEGFTDKQTRHCVNSVSLSFVEEGNKSTASNGKPRGDTDVMPISEYIQGKGYEQYDVATFAGGCFWCTEAAFERINGVVDVISGYSGGKEAYPSYQQVGYGRTGHTESIMIYFDPEVVSYETLLEVFFVAHDPTQVDRQGPDVGPQYRSAIFYHNEAEKAKIDAFLTAQKGKFSQPIATEVAPFREFWVAEGYHQDYYELNPNQPYVVRISKPKVKKVLKTFPDLIKPAYQ